MLLNSGVNKHAVMMQEQVSDIMPGWRMPEKQDVRTIECMNNSIS